MYFTVNLTSQSVQEPRLAFDWLATSASLPVAVDEVYRVESYQKDNQRLESDRNGDAEPVFRQVLLTIGF
jgi:hypothetical protein